VTDYTPTTEEVREAVIKHFMPSRGYSSMSPVEFDRWLIADRKRVAEMAQERLLSKITRVTLVDDDRGGIQYERYGINVTYSIQDDGKTLKLFIKGS
jgi:hypothetical protein